MELGQVTLPGSCPVCAHTPLSSDLCKPNKALRTTLKAFLRTEEKKREKDRQSATPATGAGAGTVEDTPAASEQPATETPVAASEDQNVVREQQAEVAPSAEVASEEQQPVGSRPEAGEEPASDVIPEAAATEDQPRVIFFYFESLVKTERSLIACRMRMTPRRKRPRRSQMALKAMGPPSRLLNRILRRLMGSKCFQALWVLICRLEGSLWAGMDPTTSTLWHNSCPMACSILQTQWVCV